MSATRSRFRLSDAQLSQFDAQGYLAVEGVFSPADLRPVIDGLSGVIDERVRSFVASGELSRDYAEYGFEKRLAMIDAECATVARSMWAGVHSIPAIFNLIRNESLLDIAEAICGTELVASSVYRLRPKISHHPMGPVPWHQGSGYFEPYCDNALVLTVWIPLVDATRENGCLWVMPGVHRGPVRTHRNCLGTVYLEIVPDVMPDVEPVCVPVRKGGVLLMTNRTPHASFENETDSVRWSMDLRYQSAALPTNATLTRLPDESLPDPDHGVPAACYPPEADFLVRSRLRPTEVVTDPAVFHEIRSKHRAQRVTSRW